MTGPERARLRAALDTLLRLAGPSAGARSGADAWRDLLEGRLCLVESLDVDGHRVLIARRAMPGEAVRSALTAPEARALLLRATGASYKAIAGELKLSTAAAHNLVQSGMRKLGVHDEAELPGLVVRSESERAGPRP